MNSLNFKDKYPINTIEISKDSSNFNSVDAIIEHIKAKVLEHPVATYIATFDNYEHTSSLKVGEIDKKIINAKIAIFCFGKEIPTPLVLGVRPRSIGVAELENSFVLSFLEAPNQNANDTMKEWCKGVKK